MAGYEFAVNDQLLYMALVPRYFDPSLAHPHDVYLNLFVARTQTTLFLFLAPLLRWFGWEWPVFVFYGVVKFFIFFGVWSLAWGLTRDRWAAAFAVLFLVWNDIMKEMTVQFYSFTFICRYAVIPLLFFGLRRLWDRRYLGAAVFFGAAFQIHALTTIYLLAIAGVCLLWNMRDILWKQTQDGGRYFDAGELRKMLPGLGVFILLAAPMLIWSRLTPMPPAPPEFTSEEWFDYSRVWKGLYIFYGLWSKEHFQAFVLCLGFLVLPLYRLWRDGTARWYAPTALGALAVMGAHFVVTELTPFQPLYQLQWYRAGDVLPLLAAIGVARVVSAEAAKPWRWVPAFAAACFLVAITAEAHRMIFSLAALLLLTVMQFEKKRRWFSGFLVVFGALPLLVRLQLHVKTAGSHVNVFWSTPIFCVAAAFLFYLIFYIRNWIASRDFANKSAQRLAAGFVCGASMIALAVGVFYAPEWVSRYGPARAATRFKDGLNRINGPGKALDNDSVRLQLWAKTNTPAQAMFFVPPGLNGFRVFSERSVFVEYFDGEVGIFSALMAYEWRERIRLMGFDPTQKQGLGYAWSAFHRISPEQWRELSKQYNAEYLVTRSRAKLPFDRLRLEGRYALWRITDAGP